MKQPDTQDRLCDCRVWRKALAPLLAAATQVHLKARASAPIDGVAMRRVPAELIHELREASYQAGLMFPVADVLTADTGKEQ
jgi:hypothetical protein